MRAQLGHFLIPHVAENRPSHGHLLRAVRSYRRLALDNSQNPLLGELPAVFVADLSKIAGDLFEGARRRARTLTVVSVTHGTRLVEQSLAVD